MAENIKGEAGGLESLGSYEVTRHLVGLAHRNFVRIRQGCQLGQKTNESSSAAFASGAVSSIGIPIQIGIRPAVSYHSTGVPFSISMFYPLRRANASIRFSISSRVTGSAYHLP